MRIAMIGQKGIPAIHGGVERHVHDLSVRLVEKGHEVTVYARKWYTGSRGINYVEGIKRIHTPTIKTKHLDTITHVFISTIHALFQGYEVIHYHGVGPALLAWIPRIFAPRTRVIITLHSLDRFHKKWNWFARYVLHLGERAACIFAHETIVISQSLKHYTKKNYKRMASYIPNGVEIPGIVTSEAHINAFGLTRGNYVVMISRLVPHKGAHLLVEAFKKFKDRNQDNHAIQSLKLAIVGGSVYTDDYVKELLISAGTLNDIIFTDFQSGEALNELYAHARVMIHPSLNEGLPITVLQAMSHGIPVLLSSIPEHKEIISNTEVFFKENDVESLVTRLEKFMEWTLEKQKQIGRENKAIIHERYSWQNIVSLVEDVYKKNILTHESYHSQLKI